MRSLKLTSNEHGQRKSHATRRREEFAPGSRFFYYRVGKDAASPVADLSQRSSGSVSEQKRNSPITGRNGTLCERQTALGERGNVKEPRVEAAYAGMGERCSSDSSGCRSPPLIYGAGTKRARRTKASPPARLRQQAWAGRTTSRDETIAQSP